jgi:hypothetical protein
MTKYFDTLSFDEEILKPRVKSKYSQLLPNIMMLNVYRLKRTYAIGSRSNIINSLDAFNETYYELNFESMTMGVPGGDISPYYAFIITIDPETVFVTRTNMVMF